MPIPIAIGVALAIRLAIQTAVTTGIWLGVDKILLPYLKDAVQDYMVANGATEQEAIDSVANDVIDIVGTFGAIAVSIRSKFPTKAAEYLGFTTKGWVKRKVVTTAVTSKAPITLPVPVVGTTAITAAATTAQQTVNNAIITKAGFKQFYDLGIKTLGVGFLAAMTIGNWIDFGNWGQGAYQGTFQRIFAKISGGLLVPDEDYRESLTVSSEVFDKVFQTYKLEGATHINDPFKGQTVEFTRDNLLDLTDKVGAKLLSTKGTAGTKDVLFATQTMIVFSGIVGGGTLGYVGTSQGGFSTPAGTTSTIPKVYTGIVSQGVIGRGLEFIPRQDDLIESLQELQVAAANNLTPFLQSLLGKIVYEVKIVSSVVSKEGFKQTGTVQQIRNGSYADGKPKYKTVVNKFAQLNLYVLTDKGVRSKITTITLGPTDSSKFSVGPNELRSIEAAIPDMVFTKDINEITGIETINSITVSTPLAAGGTPTPAPQTGPVVTSAPPVSTQAPSASVAGINALTLFDWFGARGQTVPSMSVRAVAYEAFGLGQAVYYTGTAEQNTKLLNKYKTEALNAEVKRLTDLKDKAESKEPTSAPSSSSSSKSVPTVKGKKVNISSSKINEKTNSRKEKYAVIDGTIFSVSEYTDFKKQREKFLKS